MSWAVTQVYTGLRLFEIPMSNEYKWNHAGRTQQDAVRKLAHTDRFSHGIEHNPLLLMEAAAILSDTPNPKEK